MKAVKYYEPWVDVECPQCLTVFYEDEVVTLGIEFTAGIEVLKFVCKNCCEQVRGTRLHC